MKKNIGSTDRMVRIALAILIGFLYYFDVIQGTLAYVLIAIAAIFIFTSLINFCPLYAIFGLSTSKAKN
ncbi:MAG: DUF2892 domain-containing protein [Maribacter sp.]|nr:DUF2892 domain-containing protein [Maribacter sp.]